MLKTELRNGLAWVLYKELRRSQQWIGHVMGTNKNVISAAVSRIRDFDKLFKEWLAREVYLSAHNITDRMSYETEIERLCIQNQHVLHEQAKLQDEKTKIAYRTMYATYMAFLWKRLQQNKPADIYQYQDTIISPQKNLEGHFIRVPSKELPRIARMTHQASRPYLVVSSNSSGTEFCDEIGGELNVQSNGAEDKVMPLQSIEKGEVYRTCLSYFQRNKYDSRNALFCQIEQRARKELAPVYMRLEHLFLAEPQYASNGKD